MLEKIVLINGSLYEYDGSLSAHSLLTYLGFNTGLIIIDYNGCILPKEQWGQVLIKNKDQIEIITLAGGG
jgi:thiamine biosynthesis protein ThiS